MKQYVKPETESFQTTPNTTLCASAQVGVTLGTMKVKSFLEPNKSPILVFALMLSGMLLLPSCKNGNGDVQQPSAFKKGEVVTITTNPIGAGNKTPRKVHIGSEENKEAQMVWTEGDHLRVIVPESSTSFPHSDFVLTAGANEETGTFTGTMPADGSEFFLAYPCGDVKGSKYESSTFTFQGVSVPNVQDFTVGAKTFNPGLMPVVGYGKDDNGTLTGTTTIVGGALRVKLTNSTGKDLTFNKVRLYVPAAKESATSEKSTSVWSSGYTVDYNVESGAVTPSGTSADNKNIVLNLSDKVTLANEVTSDYFYFVMLAPLYFSTSNGSSFVIYLYNYDGKVTETSDLSSQTPVATTSFNYNIAIAQGDIVEGTLEMTQPL
ncbi:MAG: hypothetical protein MJZ58_00505 [Paludibacteraceae bacterium]|nr:hypothetical protein [Paludibacteraceae bacterium]